MRSTRVARANRPGRIDPTYFIVLFALAVAVTPEFSFLGVPKVRLTDLLLPVILTVFCGSLVTGEVNSKVPLLPLMGAILFWDLFVLFVLAPDPNTGLGALYLCKRFFYFLIFLAGNLLVTSSAGFERSIWALIGASPFLCFTVLYAQARGVLEGEYRASGIIEDQETSTALFLVMIFALALAMWPAAQTLFHKIVLFLALGSSVLAILATGSKTGLILTTSVAFVLIPRTGKHFPIVLTLLSLIAFAGVAFTPDQVLERFGRIRTETTDTYRGLTMGEEYMGDAGGDSLADRYYMAKGAFNNLIPQAPFSGLGAAYRPLGAIDNTFITEWVYHGLVGLLLWLVLLYSLTALLWRGYQTSVDPVERGATAGILATVGCFVLGGFTADTFYVIRPMEGFMLLAGMVVGRLRCRTAQPFVRPGPDRGTRRRIRPRPPVASHSVEDTRD